MHFTKLTRYLIYWPFCTLALCGVLAFAPVSLMLLSLKNDIVAIDYPIKFFLSECIRNGVNPLWCNTWAMGFPLESVLTWSVFSPLQFIFSLPGPYTLYLLHLEFTSYVVLAGWSMYYFLRKHTDARPELHWLLSCAYMLSGFVVGSSQWFTYLTAAAFLPLSLALLLNLLRQPSYRNAILLSITGYIMVTSVYAAFLITLAYIMCALTAVKFVQNRRQGWQKTGTTIKCLGVSLLLFLLLVSPALHATFQVLGAMDRGKPLVQSHLFTQSNYVSVPALKSLLLPLANTRLQSPNTEGAMSQLYIGLLPLLLLPFSVRRWRDGSLLLAGMLFLLLSMGMETPLRSWVNQLPGFGYFRNPGLFRLFFIFFILWHLGRYGATAWNSLLHTRKFLLAGFAILIYLLATLLLNGSHLLAFTKAGSITQVLNLLKYPQATAASALMQALILLLVLFALYKKQLRWVLFASAADLVINTLICTPFYTVSSYSLPAAQERLQMVAGFPVQTSRIDKVPTAIHSGNANWYNIHVLSKQVSSRPSYYGPLFLKEFDPEQHALKDSAVQFLQAYTQSAKQKITITVQQPGYVCAMVEDGTTQVRLQQHFFKGWHAYLNNKPLTIHTAVPHSMTVDIPEAGKLEFVYEKRGLWFWAIALNSMVVCFFLLWAINRLRKTKSHVPV